MHISLPGPAAIIVEWSYQMPERRSPEVGPGTAAGADSNSYRLLFLIRCGVPCGERP